MITGKSIAKGALIVMTATLLSRLIGFVREQTIAAYFGLTGPTDAYLVALTVPSGLGMAIWAALSAGLIPVLNSYFVRDETQDASNVLNTVLNSMFLLLTAVTAAGILSASLLAARLAPGFNHDALVLTARLMGVMFPGLVFVSLMGAASGYLNTRQRFLMPALGPAVTSIVTIGFVVVLGRSYGIMSLALGTTAGYACQLLIQLPVMYRTGYRYRLVMALSHPGVRKVFRLLAPVLLSSLVPPLMILIEKALASGLTTGSISALNYAFRMMQLPQGLFVMAVSIPLFPALSSYAAKGEFARLQETLIKGVSILALIMVPAGALFIALDEPIVRLLFQRGAFSAKDTGPTAYALAFYGLALLPLAARDIFRRGFYSMQDSVTPLKITFAGFGINIILDLALVRLLGIGGLALGAALSILAETVILYFVLNKKLPSLPGKSLIILIVKLMAASVVMGAAAYYLSDLIGPMVNLERAGGRLAQVGGAMAGGLVVYLVAIIILRVREIGEALDMARNIRRKSH